MHVVYCCKRLNFCSDYLEKQMVWPSFHVFLHLQMAMDWCYENRCTWNKNEVILFSFILIFFDYNTLKSDKWSQGRHSKNCILFGGNIVLLDSLAILKWSSFHMVFTYRIEESQFIWSQENRCMTGLSHTTITQKHHHHHHEIMSSLIKLHGTNFMHI